MPSDPLPLSPSGRRLSKTCEGCEQGWERHDVIVCPGSIACGGYLPHDCATPGCMEPEWGVHGPECRGWLIACPSPEHDAFREQEARTLARAEVIAEAVAELTLPRGEQFWYRPADESALVEVVRLGDVLAALSRLGERE